MQLPAGWKDAMRKIVIPEIKQILKEVIRGEVREIFDQPFEYKLVRRGSEATVYIFTTSYMDKYEVFISHYPLETLFRAYEISEEEMKEILTPRGYSGKEMASEIIFYKMSGRLRSTSITRTPDYTRIISTVLHIVREELKGKDEVPVLFSAKEESRYNLYMRMAKRFKRNRDEIVEIGGDEDSSTKIFLLPVKGRS